MSEKAIRSIGSATISFGMVSIPTKIYSATQSTNAISFNLLHKGCGSRLKQQYICAQEGTVVEREQMVKGYEFAKGQFVQFTAEEIKSLEEKSSYSIDITEFVPVSKVDPIYFDKAYFLAPDRGAAKAYSLLTEAMTRSNQAAIAHYASRGKSYIVMLRSVNSGIVMQTLLYSDEVRSIKDVPLDPQETKDAELFLALKLVESLACPDFDPTKYRDDVRERMEKAIEDKIAGKEITVPAPEATPHIVDLMAALKASLGKAEEKRA